MSASRPEAPVVPRPGDLLSNLEAVLDVIAVKVKKIFFYDEKFLDIARLAEFVQMLATRGISVGCCELPAKVFIEKEHVPALSVKVLQGC
jgi:hypothetical protein